MPRLPSSSATAIRKSPLPLLILSRRAHVFLILFILCILANSVKDWMSRDEEDGLDEYGAAHSLMENPPQALVQAGIPPQPNSLATSSLIRAKKAAGSSGRDPSAMRAWSWRRWA